MKLHTNDPINADQNNQKHQRTIKINKYYPFIKKLLKPPKNIILK